MYSVMSDATPDLSNRDQMSVCVRYINSSWKVLERLIELVEIIAYTGKDTARNICDVLKKTALIWNILHFNHMIMRVVCLGNFTGL